MSNMLLYKCQKVWRWFVVMPWGCQDVRSCQWTCRLSAGGEAPSVGLRPRETPRPPSPLPQQFQSCIRFGFPSSENSTDKYAWIPITKYHSFCCSTSVPWQGISQLQRRERSMKVVTIQLPRRKMRILPTPVTSNTASLKETHVISYNPALLVSRSCYVWI